MFYNWVNDKEKLKDTLSLLRFNSPALWGRMDAQQMVEHLIILFEISSKKQQTNILTPEKYLEKSQAILMSDEPMPKNFVAKFLPIGPTPYLYSSLVEANYQLLFVLSAYQVYWKERENERLNHPIFGSLTKDMWDRVHNKHIHHHFLQFGLIK